MDVIGYAGCGSSYFDHADSSFAAVDAGFFLYSQHSAGTADHHGGAKHCRDPEFFVLSTIILFATMLRLGLNVASTRVVLLEGHQGGDAAGKVIAAFGEFVIGGNYVVGFIVFAILMIINFIVITRA